MRRGRGHTCMDDARVASHSRADVQGADGGRGGWRALARQSGRTRHMDRLAMHQTWKEIYGLSWSQDWRLVTAIK